MSGVCTDEMLYCSYCKSKTLHVTESEFPHVTVWAQCMTCLPGRWITAIDIPPTKVGKLTYFKVNRSHTYEYKMRNVHDSIKNTNERRNHNG